MKIKKQNLIPNADLKNGTLIKSLDNLRRILKHIREFNGLTQDQLAKQIGFSRSYICEIELGLKEPSLDLVKSYAVTFSIPTSQIMLFAENYQESKGIKAKVKKNVINSALKLLDFINN